MDESLPQPEQPTQPSQDSLAEGKSKRTLWIILGVVIVLIILGVAYFMMAGKGSDETATTSPDNLVVYTSSGYAPENILISPGDTVTWRNDSDSEITVDSAPHPIHTSYPELNLGSAQPGSELSFTFPTAGEFNYHNHLSAGKVGTVTVE